MALCSSCGAERPPHGPCPKCGAIVSKVPELELSVPPRSGPKPPRPKKEAEELRIDLAFDPRGPYAPLSRDSAPCPPSVGNKAVREAAPSSRAAAVRVPRMTSMAPDANSDARLLADHGEPPRHWLLSPVYAWRVLARRRELKRVLAARKEEAKRAAAEAEDALVATAEQFRAVAEQQATFADVVGALRRAEELLRMRDRVLTAENEAEMARLASADARLTKLESDLTAAQGEERSEAADLVAAQESLAREEAHLKRTESELRAAQREPSGTRE